MGAQGPQQVPMQVPQGGKQGGPTGTNMASMGSGSKSDPSFGWNQHLNSLDKTAWGAASPEAKQNYQMGWQNQQNQMNMMRTQGPESLGMGYRNPESAQRQKQLSQALQMGQQNMMSNQMNQQKQGKGGQQPRQMPGGMAGQLSYKQQTGI